LFKTPNIKGLNGKKAIFLGGYRTYSLKLKELTPLTWH